MVVHKSLKTLALAIGLAAAPAVAMAEGSHQGQQPQGGMQGGQSGMSGGQSGSLELRPGSTSITGTIKGTVTALNLSRGLVTVSSGAGGQAGSLTLNALPSQIADLNPGDLVALNYLNYGGQRWLAISQGGGQGGSGASAMNQESFGQYGTVTGYVQQLNKGSGTITVRGMPFRTHPQFLQSLLPGQFVSVNFAEIGGVNWAEQIQPTGGQGGQSGSPQGQSSQGSAQGQQ